MNLAVAGASVSHVHISSSFYVISSRIRNTQAAFVTKGTALFEFFLEHSSDPSMKSTCAKPHMNWYQALLVLMTDEMSEEGSGEHVRLRNLVRVLLLTTINISKWKLRPSKILDMYIRCVSYDVEPMQMFIGLCRRCDQIVGGILYGHCKIKYTAVRAKDCNLKYLESEAPKLHVTRRTLLCLCSFLNTGRTRAWKRHAQSFIWADTWPNRCDQGRLGRVYAFVQSRPLTSEWRLRPNKF